MTCTLDRVPSTIGGHYKIADSHLRLLAYIYVRQSTLKQVERNRESQAAQYDLVRRAAALGWQQERIRVIDCDLGLSGRSSEHRSGFKELIAEVSLGRVGIIFGYEVSRLARNNSDWYHLLDLAAVFGTLIADNDGLYDPRLYNDRLLLGLKGTMSEAELHLLQQRMEAGRLRQVERGEYRQHLPTGLVRLPDGQVIKDPDEQVRHVIELVLVKLEELGSCGRVLRYLRREGVLLPRRQTSGPDKGKTVWKPPHDAAVYAIVRNPAYAGAFAYGRRQTDPMRRQPGHPASGHVHKPMEKWIHLQMDVYPAYITWEQYLRNREQLRQNGKRFAKKGRRVQGAAQEGAALLQGLAVCGRCGYRMRVTYKYNHRYQCSALSKQFGEPTCCSLHGPSVDEVVVQAFFDAIRPAQLDALEAVLSARQVERERLARQWEERLERVRYEAQLAQRQYDAVDPDNRLVAAELERRWEENLRQLQTTQEAYDRFQQSQASTPLVPPEWREQLEHISDSLPELWQSERLSNVQRKQLLRCLISQVVLTKEAPDNVEVKIVWISGHYSTAYVHPSVFKQQDVTGYDEMVERINSLWQRGLDDEQIAARLVKEGFRSARSSGVSSMTVHRIRLAHEWYRPRHYGCHALELDGYLTTRGLAARLGVKRRWVYHRIRSGQIAPTYITRHPQSDIYLIQDDPELIAHLQQLPAKKR